MNTRRLKMIEIIIFLWIIWPIMAGSIAYSKGRNWFGWALLGVLIGLFGVIWVAALPAIEDGR